MGAAEILLEMLGSSFVEVKRNSEENLNQHRHDLLQSKPKDFHQKQNKENTFFKIICYISMAN